MIIHDEAPDEIPRPFARSFINYNFIDLVQNAKLKLDGVSDEKRTRIIEKAVKMVTARPTARVTTPVKRTIKKTPTPKAGKY